MNDKKTNVIEAHIPRTDPKCDELFNAITQAIDDHRDGMARATIIGTLDVIKSNWIEGRE